MAESAAVAVTAEANASSAGAGPAGYRVLQGPVFKKPGLDPTAGRVVKLSRPVGSLLVSTGKTWTGPSGGEWAELDATAGEKPGWVLVEGPGFGQPGPLLERAEPGEATPLVLKLYSMIESKVLCEVCLRPDQTVRAVKSWIALRDPTGLRPKDILISKEEKGECRGGAVHDDDTRIQDAGWQAGDEIPYFYMGEAKRAEVLT
mmetsp:Transcript_19947/g.61607  ORF Transcript_19947/g.61607 Transcript_19947/m.61607 type:complete len:203 (+) Transcript_19947:97-705(+)